MYRIVCESYKNYKSDFLPGNYGDYRYQVSKPLELLVDLSLYKKEKNLETTDYKKIEEFIYLLKKDTDKYSSYKSFLWSLESRGIYGKSFGVLSQEDFEELVKIVNMFLKLSYWN